MGERRKAFVGIGGNVGDRMRNFEQAAAAIHAMRDTYVEDAAPLYETAPVGSVTDQPLFLNSVMLLQTSMTADELLADLQKIELGLGRKREVADGPRTIDLDLLIMEGEVRLSEGLMLPHPRILARLFVLRPLLDVIEKRWAPKDRRAFLASYGIDYRELVIAAEKIQHEQEVQQRPHSATWWQVQRSA